MAAALFNPLPQFCRYDMTERIQKVVRNHFRVSRRSRRKVQQSRIFATGALGSGRKTEFVAHVFRQFIKRNPPVHFIVHPYQKRFFIRGLRSFLNFLLKLFFLNSDNHLDACRLYAVFDVVRGQLNRCRNGNRADFMQGRQDKPKLVAPPQKK